VDYQSTPQLIHNKVPVNFNHILSRLSVGVVS
jgi:hypothetical protein